jgi:hypothetical protein
MNTNIRQVAIILCTVAVAFSGAAGTVVGAGDTSVALAPTTDEVTTGSTTTIDIVVINASDGVGAVNVTASVAQGNVATISSTSLDDSASDVTVETNSANTSATITGYGLNTTNSGQVVIGTVTIQGESAGDTDLRLEVNALGDESGVDYSISSTTDAAISVTSTSDGGGGGGGGTTTTATTTDNPTTTTDQPTTTTTTSEPITTTATETTGSQAPGFGPMATVVAIVGALALLRSSRSA